MKRSDMTLIERKQTDATKKFIREYSDIVVGMVEDFYHNHGVRPSSRTILYRLKKLGTVTKKDVKKVEALVAYLKLKGDISTYMMIDAKRTMYGTSTYPSKRAALSNLHKKFKLDLWKEQDNSILFMCEAAGYTDVISRVANQYRCDYIGSGGDISVHWKMELAEKMYTHIIYVGDMDEKGIEIPQTLIRDVNELQTANGYENTTMVRIEHDVTEYDVELENVDVEYVRDLLREKVDEFIDYAAWDNSLSNESIDRESLLTKTKETK